MSFFGNFLTMFGAPRLSMKNRLGLSSGVGNADNPNDIITLDYWTAKNIYTGCDVGKRFVEALPDFCLGSDRTIKIENAPNEVIRRYAEIEKKYKIKEVILNYCYWVRVYGMGGIFVASSKENDDYQNLPANFYTQNADIGFKVVDPLNLAGTQMGNDPLKMDFMQFKKPMVQNQVVGNRRVLIGTNGFPIFLKYELAGMNFTGRSVFLNIINRIALWEQLFKSFGGIAAKAGAVLLKGGNNNFTGNGLDGLAQSVKDRTAELFKGINSNNVADIGDKEAELFNLSGASEISAIMEQVKTAFALAISDTPLSILFHKELSGGFSEGREDFRMIAISVNSYREKQINPAYDFVDSYLYKIAWSDDFIRDLQIKYKDWEFANMSPIQVRELWKQGFSYEWDNIFPPTPEEKTKEKDGILDRLVKLKELGGSAESIEQVLNNEEVFPNEVFINDLLSEDNPPTSLEDLLKSYENNDLGLENE